MSEKKNNLFVIILVAVVIAIAAAALLLVGINQQLDAVKVYRVNQNKIESGNIITSNMITEVNVPRSGVHKEAVRNVKNIVGRAALTDLYYGQQIISPVLSKNKNDNRLASKISQGTNNRIMAIPGDSLNTFGGLLTENDYIDILVHFPSFQLTNNSETKFTKELFEQVPIVELIKHDNVISEILKEVTPYQA
ncbi:MAG: Flp pilus assembly protein CpaB, partial [Candidatus Woesearchaeota archaeon]